MFATNRPRRLLAVAACAATMLLIGACASAPPSPTAALTEAKSAIQAAERDDASHFAAAELDKARQKLILANKAVVAEDMILAERFAQEATVTANLAAAKTAATKAVAINEEMGRGTEALLEEMQRVGDQQ